MLPTNPGNPSQTMTIVDKYRYAAYPISFFVNSVDENNRHNFTVMQMKLNSVTLVVCSLKCPITVLE